MFSNVALTVIFAVITVKRNSRMVVWLMTWKHWVSLSDLGLKNAL